MKICLAQIESSAGNIEKNIDSHLKAIETAANYQVDFIVFPELSITGYEPKFAPKLAFNLEDKRLAIFQNLSEKYQMLIGLGLPLKSLTGTQIGMAIFRANQEPLSYAKQLLHSDELPFFEAGNKQVFIDYLGLRLAPAICYESLQTKHLQKCLKHQIDVYVASVAKPQQNIAKATTYFSHQALQHQLPIVMCNAVGNSDNFISAGQSAVWNNKGELIAQLGAKEEGLIVYDTQSQQTITFNM